MTNKFSDKTFLECINQTIPGIKVMNKAETKTPKIEPLRMMLNMELAMIDTIHEEKITSNEEERVKNNNIEEQPTNEKVEEIQTGVKTEVLENNVPTKFTDEYNGVKVKNGTDNKLTK